MTIETLTNEQNVPVVIADAQGFVTYVNEAFQRVFGWSAGEIVGKPLSVIIPKSLHDAHHLGFSRFLSSGKPTLLNQPLTLRAVTKDGREFDAEHIITAERRNEGWVFGATIRPL